jgi:hypothetical protein
MLLSVGDGLIVLCYTSVPTTSPLLHPAPPNHFNWRFRISFRINTSKGVSQVFILNDLQKGLSPLESALTRNQGVGRKHRPAPFPTCATRTPWLGRRCFAAFAPCYVVCFQTNTNCPSCKSFVLITIQIAGGGGYSSLRRSLSKPRPTRVRCWVRIRAPRHSAKAPSPGFAQPIVPNQLLVRRDYGRAPSSIPLREWLLVQARGTKFRGSSIQF